MSSLMNTLEKAIKPRPGVINVELIKTAIHQMLQDDIPGMNIDEEEGYDFSEVTYLSLEHFDILYIDHLWIMPALTVLKLTGNLIDKIENLDALVNLKDLNLSFNRIKEIENLEKLLQLRQLSLFSNKISRIQNVDHLTNLKIFSIGNNKIEDRSCVLQLRKLNLFCLNMAGNPCVKDGFRHFVAGYIPKLEYYEYKKITEEERETGRRIHLNDLDVLERAEREEEKLKNEAAARTEIEEKYFQAFVEKLNENQLNNAISESDPNGRALLLMGDDAYEIFKHFEQEIEKCANDIFNIGLEQFEIRKKEVELFNESIKEAESKSLAKQREITESFLEEKSKTFGEINEMCKEVPANSELPRETFYKEMDKAFKMCLSMKQELTNLELVLSDQLKDVFSLFERNLGDMVNYFIETAQGFFTNMREHETVLSEQLGDQASRFLNQLILRNEDLSSIPILLRPIMIDKEAVNTAVATSHDVHLQIIDSCEDQLISRTRAWYQKLCHDYEQDEQNRSRDRINQITIFWEKQFNEFEQCRLSFENEAFTFGVEGEESAEN